MSNRRLTDEYRRMFTRTTKALSEISMWIEITLIGSHWAQSYRQCHPGLRHVVGAIVCFTNSEELFADLYPILKTGTPFPDYTLTIDAAARRDEAAVMKQWRENLAIADLFNCRNASTCAALVQLPEWARVLAQNDQSEARAAADEAWRVSYIR